MSSLQRITKDTVLIPYFIGSAYSENSLKLADVGSREGYENHWQAVQLIHCARPACIRVFGRKRRGQAKACGAACATYISKNKNENQIQSAFSKSQI